MRVAGQRKIEDLKNRQYYHYEHESYCNTFHDCQGYWFGNHIIICDLFALNSWHCNDMTIYRYPRQYDNVLQ